jgi:excisionase family DNA binding protein
MSEEELLTTDQIAELLKLHRDSVRRMLKDKRLPGVKIGNQYRVRRRDLDAWLNHGGESDQEK